jgi:hypothetical protein
VSCQSLGNTFATMSAPSIVLVLRVYDRPQQSAAVSSGEGLEYSLLQDTPTKLEVIHT